MIIVLPGVAAAILAPELSAPDKAYPTVMDLLPTGILGLVFAALIAAIVSSLASMMNSISTIFTMDLHRNFKKGKQSEAELVRTGRIACFSAIVIAMIVARPLLGNFSQAFQYIQEFTGFFTPGVCALFLLGFFWPRTTSMAALARIFHQGGPIVIIFHFKQCIRTDFMLLLRLHFVLSGFTQHLASHFARSFSNHSYRYGLSNDRTNCFASYTVNSGSLMKYAG